MEGFLKLSSGEVYPGKWITDINIENVVGEIVFFTGMTGYQEVLTDPSYKDQIIVFTYPLIGNYGINDEDFESLQPHVAGVVVYETNDASFHYEAKHTLREYLQKWNIPMLGHVDTRTIVKNIRARGSMPAVLSKNNNEETEFELHRTSKVDQVSVKETQVVGSGDIHIVLVDFGYKKSILSALLARGCQVTIVPHTTSYEKIAQYKPDGIILSNGPGDPKELKEELTKIKKVLLNYPTLGICLGHQLTALALGGQTKKLSFGHRGANHPIYDQNLKKVLISSQNHSFVVDEGSLGKTNLKVRFKNLHDQSIEGLVHQTLPVQTVQFHPEANPGPSDSDYIFDEFIEVVIQNSGGVIAYA